MLYADIRDPTSPPAAACTSQLAHTGPTGAFIEVCQYTLYNFAEMRGARVGRLRIMKRVALICGMTLASSVGHAETLDTMENAVGHVLTATSPGGDRTIMHFRKDHTFQAKLIDPNGTSAWIVEGSRVCQRTEYGPRECHIPAGRWIIDQGKLCMMPDGSAQNWRECFALDKGKKLGDTWKQTEGKIEYTLSITADQ
jgi:hypothetical protein